ARDPRGPKGWRPPTRYARALGLPAAAGLRARWRTGRSRHRRRVPGPGARLSRRAVGYERPSGGAITRELGALLVGQHRARVVLGVIDEDRDLRVVLERSALPLGERELQVVDGGGDLLLAREPLRVRLGGGHLLPRDVERQVVLDLRESREPVLQCLGIDDL